MGNISIEREAVAAQKETLSLNIARFPFLVLLLKCLSEVNVQYRDFVLSVRSDIHYLAELEITQLLSYIHHFLFLVEKVQSLTSVDSYAFCFIFYFFLTWLFFRLFIFIATLIRRP